MAETCSVCGEPVHVGARHVVFTRQVETEYRGSVTVHDADVLARTHDRCADQVAVTTTPLIGR